MCEYRGLLFDMTGTSEWGGMRMEGTSRGLIFNVNLSDWPEESQEE